MRAAVGFLGGFEAQLRYLNVCFPAIPLWEVFEITQRAIEVRGKLPAAEEWPLAQPLRSRRLEAAMRDPIDNEALREEIARRAYTKFCDRGCAYGSDTEDWLAAEREVLAEQEQPAEMPKTQNNPPRRRNPSGRR